MRMKKQWIKWKLMVTTLPFVVALVGVRFFLDNHYNFQGFLDFSDVGPVLTAAAVLIGYMLSNTTSDYKESERLPGEVAASLETMEETYAWAAVTRSQLDVQGFRRRLAALTDEIFAWLTGKKTSEGKFQSLQQFNQVVTELERAGASNPASRFLAELHALRRVLTRMGVIARTGFLASGYALLDFLVVSVVVLMLVASYKNPFAKYVILTSVPLTYLYMLRLVRDIDNPFDYAADGKQKGAAEVELFPLHEYRQRLGRRIENE